MKTFADKIIEFNQSLDFQDKLPDGIRIMRPYHIIAANICSATI